MHGCKWNKDFLPGKRVVYDLIKPGGFDGIVAPPDGIPIVGDIKAQLQLHRYGHSLEQRILDSLPATVGTLHSIHW